MKPALLEGQGRPGLLLTDKGLLLHHLRLHILIISPNIIQLFLYNPTVPLFLSLPHQSCTSNPHASDGQPLVVTTRFSGSQLTQPGRGPATAPPFRPIPRHFGLSLATSRARCGPMKVFTWRLLTHLRKQPPRGAQTVRVGRGQG